MADEFSDDEWSPYGSPSEVSPDASEAEEAPDDYDGAPEISDEQATQLLDALWRRHNHRTVIDHLVWPEEDSDDESMDPSWHPFPNDPRQ